MPIGSLDIFVLLQIRVVYPRHRDVVHHLNFRAVYFDVVGRSTVGWVVRIDAADVGDFGDHVVGVRAFGPEGDADILHAVALEENSVSSQVKEFRIREFGSLRKYSGRELTYDRDPHTSESTDEWQLSFAHTHYPGYRKRSDSQNRTY